MQGAYLLEIASASEYLWFLDTLVAARVSERRGSNGISVLEHRAPHGDSPPPHLHHTEDEIFHVLEGELEALMQKDGLEPQEIADVLPEQGLPDEEGLRRIAALDAKYGFESDPAMIPKLIQQHGLRM